MLQIQDIVNVTISRETASKTVRDLQTIAILSKHDRFTEAYRKYSSTKEMLDEGFITTDFAYIAAQRIFRQEPTVREIVVGRIATSTSSIDYPREVAALQAANSDWFFLIADAEDAADKIAIAKYVEDETMVYVYSTNDVNVLDQSDKTSVASQLQELGLLQTFGMFTRDASVIAPEAAWVGRFASDVIGSNTWIHKPLASLIADGFTRTEITTLKNKNVHFYTKVGKDDSIEGSASVAGGEKISVILGVIWIKVRMAERLWNLLYTKDRINYTNAGVELFKAEVVTVLSEAVVNNILTDDDGFTIQVPDANKLSSQVRQSGVLGKITFRARLAGAILFINAIEGTVYA